MALGRRRSSTASARSPGRKEGRARRAGVFLLASISLALLPQQSAVAHDSTTRYRERISAHIPEMCVRHGAEQNHTWHYVMTISQTANCFDPLYRDPGYINQRQEYYKSPPWNGAGAYTRCAVNPYYTFWSKNTRRAYQLSRIYNEDIWGWGCNHGPGVHVTITMDTWHRVAYNHAWFPSIDGAAYRPYTSHCHCP